MTLVRPTGSFRTGGSGGGGPADLAQGLLSPGNLDLPQAGVAWVRVDLSVDTSHDRVELGLYEGSRLASTDPGSSLTVALGDAGTDTDVATAEVAGVASRPEGPVLYGYAPSRRLSERRVARSYISQSVGDVVTDLLEDAGVDVGDVDAPQSLAAYHVDPNLPVWLHLHRLARLVGCQVTSRPDGAVSFGPAPGATPTGGLSGLAAAAGAVAGAGGAFLGGGGGGGLRTGENVLAYESGPARAEPAATSPVAALGAASGLGPERWYHVVREPDTAGGIADVSPAVRDQDLAEAATTARADAARRRQRVARIRAPGDPALRAGGEVWVDGSQWRLLRIRHLLSGLTGYVCELALEGT